MRGYRKSIWFSALAVLLLAGAVAMANAQNQKRLQKGGGAMALRGQLLAGLNLTDQQKEQVKTILSSHKADIKEAATATMKARRDLRQALATGADQATLKANYDAVTAAGWNDLMLRRNIGAEIKPILTAEQQAKLEKRLGNLKKIGQLRLENRKKKLDV